MKKSIKRIMDVVSILGYALVALFIMLLWNWLVPGITGWTAINYWQAVGLLVLSRLLTSSQVVAKKIKGYDTNDDEWDNDDIDDEEEIVINKDDAKNSVRVLKRGNLEITLERRK